MLDSLGADIYTYIDVDIDSTHKSNFKKPDTHATITKYFIYLIFFMSNQQTFEHRIFSCTGNTLPRVHNKRMVGAYSTLTIACTNALHSVDAINY